MTSWFRRAGANILRILSQSLDPSAATSEFQLYSKVASGKTELFGRSSDGTVYQITPPASGGSSNELWAPPAVAHAADDEFDNNALDPVWQQTGSGVDPINFGTRPQPYTDPGAIVAGSFENRRGRDIATDPTINTWLRVQPGSSSGMMCIWQPLDAAPFGGTVPNDLLAWARFDFGYRNAQALSSGDASIGISFFERDPFGPGTGFAFADHATVALNNTEDLGTGSRIRPRFYGRNGGVGSTVIASEGNGQEDVTNSENIAGFLSGYVGIQRRVVTAVPTYDAWVLDDGGRLWLGTLSGNDVSANANSIAIWYSNAAGGAAGTMYGDIDFIRFIQGTPYWTP